MLIVAPCMGCSAFKPFVRPSFKTITTLKANHETCMKNDIEEEKGDEKEGHHYQGRGSLFKRMTTKKRNDVHTTFKRMYPKKLSNFGKINVGEYYFLIRLFSF